MILVIAFLLVGVIVAVLILQVTNMMRAQAMNTQRQASERMAKSIQIDRVYGCVAGTGDRYVYLLILRVRPGMGADSVDLRDTTLQYIGINKSMFASYEPLSQKYPITGACDAEVSDFYTLLNASTLCDIFSALAPKTDNNQYDATKFTVIWENCEGYDDLYALYDVQTAYIIYPLPEHLVSGNRVTLELSLSTGWSYPLEIVIPSALNRNYVQIFP